MRTELSGDGVITAVGPEVPALIALSVTGDDAEAEAFDGAAFRISRRIRLGDSPVQTAFYLSAGPEPDGASATVRVLRRQGWRDLLASTRDSLRGLELTTGHAATDRLINRNLFLAYFYAVGRALDDAQFYLVRTRAPWHSAGVTVRDWDALMWTIPAVQLADGALARELLLRMCEIHGHAAGRGVQYFEGSLFEPGFNLDGLAAFVVAVERYIRDTGDEFIVDEPAIADTLYLVGDVLASRRDKGVPLYSTDVTIGGDPPVHPFTLQGNAVAAMALDALRRAIRLLHHR
jgi:hypothetical protein